MSRSSTPPSPETPHLVSLVLHSKKALQHGEQLCFRAQGLSRATAALATDVWALHAKVRWMSQTMDDQLRLVCLIAKSIEIRRHRLIEQTREWDKARAFHSKNIDAVLESLERQVVPPDFYQSPLSSSIFGSDHDSEVDEASTKESKRTRGRRTDKCTWKTLRDFVDVGGIVNATEEIDDDRDVLENIMAKADEFPQVLNHSVSSLRKSLPCFYVLPSIHEILKMQDTTANSMAKHLESLASHYEQMAATLRDKEIGIKFSSEDLQEMNRDTDELPSIITELEDGILNVEATHTQLCSAKEELSHRLSEFAVLQLRLEELDDVIAEMLAQQQVVEAEHEVQLTSLQQYLTTLEHLSETFTSYETSYCNLLLEIDRRKKSRHAAEEIIKGMIKQLDTLHRDELIIRESFCADHGPHLPDDLCYFVANAPTKWDIVPALGSNNEELPELDDALLAAATKHLELTKAVTESL